MKFLTYRTWLIMLGIAMAILVTLTTLGNPVSGVSATPGKPLFPWIGIQK